MKQLNVLPTRPRNPNAEPGSSGWAAGIFALAVILCCGLPILVAVLATASALTKGVLVGVVVALVSSVVALLVRRRMCAKADCSNPLGAFVNPGTENPQPRQRSD